MLFGIQSPLEQVASLKPQADGGLVGGASSTKNNPRNLLTCDEIRVKK